MEVMESAKSKTQRTSYLFNSAQDLTLRTLFSGAYVTWLDSLDGYRWLTHRRVVIVEPERLAGLVLFQRRVIRLIHAHPPGEGEASVSTGVSKRAGATSGPSGAKCEDSGTDSD